MEITHFYVLDNSLLLRFPEISFWRVFKCQIFISTFWKNKVLITFELQTVLKLRRNWFENFNFYTSNFTDLKSQLPITCVLSAIYLKNFISPVDRKVSTSDWKCQRSCNEKLMKRKDYWHKLKGDRDELQTQLTTNIINNFMFQLTADWLTLLQQLYRVWSMLLVIFY